MKKQIIALVVGSLLATSSFAGPRNRAPKDESNRAPKEESIGLGSGAAIGLMSSSAAPPSRDQAASSRRSSTTTEKASLFCTAARAARSRSVSGANGTRYWMTECGVATIPVTLICSRSIMVGTRGEISFFQLSLWCTAS